jgi:hypothetical protein
MTTSNSYLSSDWAEATKHMVIFAYNPSEGASSGTTESSGALTRADLTSAPQKEVRLTPPSRPPARER